MSLVKSKNSLQQKQQMADMVQKIVLELKTQFANLNIEDLKADKEFLKAVMNAIEKYSSDPTLISSKVYSKLDKVEICIQIYVVLFSEYTEDEIAQLKSDMEFLITNKLVKVYGFFTRTLKKIFP